MTGTERKTKTDAINEIAQTTGLTKTVVDQVLDAAFEIIQKWVADNNEVAFIGFGTFTSSKRQARTGRNPQTGETIKIKASTSPKFKAGKTFKDAVNQKEK